MSARSRKMENKVQQAPKQEAEVETGKIAPEPEILAKFDVFDGLTVSNAQPGYVYCWVNPWGSGRFIAKKQAQGWELVKGDMPESRELIDATGYRRCADVLLMRTTQERKDAVDRDWETS